MPSDEPDRRRRRTAAIRFDIVDRADAISAVTARVAALGGRIRALATVRRIDGDPPLAEIELEVEGVGEDGAGRGPRGARRRPDRPPDPRARHASSASGSSSSAAARRSPRSRSAR